VLNCVAWIYADIRQIKTRFWREKVVMLFSCVLQTGIYLRAGKAAELFSECLGLINKISNVAIALNPHV
jgi:hypothetical protein